MKPLTSLMLARLAIFLVIVWNLQCALAFLLWPGRFAPGFGLSGMAGEAAMRGVGVLFLMWNVPYAVALWHPGRYRISLYEAIAMQAIGLLGETLIYSSQAQAPSVLKSSLERFILFDAAGLVLLLLAVWLTHDLTREI